MQLSVVSCQFSGAGTTDNRQLTTASATLPRVKLIVGLGNPGSEYARSRHNAGWMIADAFAEKFRIRIDQHEKEALTGSGRVAGGSVVVAKPVTYMNNSGDAVKLLANAYVESLQDLIVVYDEVDLPLGKLRIRERGSPGTHNG